MGKLHTLQGIALHGGLDMIYSASLSSQQESLRMDTALVIDQEKQAQPVDFQISPSGYQHWQLKFDGPIATLVMDTKEDGGIRSGYKLKLNSYDLGVDIELHDALQRLRFEHPEVRAVILTSAKSRVF